MESCAEPGKRLRALPKLSVYTYRAPMLARHLPATGRPNLDLVAAAATALLGPARTSMFSVTSDADGAFVVHDELQPLFAHAPSSTRFHCIYLHEASEERSGAQVSGTLSHLCGRLAAAEVAVLNQCTLAHTYMLVELEQHEAALRTLRSAIDGHAAAEEAVRPLSPQLAAAAETQWTHHMRRAKQILSIRLLPPSFAICSLSEDECRAAAHALMQLLLWQVCNHICNHICEPHLRRTSLHLP
jgi:hypothetical protein